MAFLMPVGGIVCCLVIAVLFLVHPLPSGDLLDEFKEHALLPELVAPKIVTPQDTTTVLRVQRGIEPLVDMLNTPDPQMKRAVLETIAKLQNPKLIPHIVAALQDPRPEVYQFAMAKVLKLQEKFQTEIAHALDAVKESPTDARLRWNLADVYNRFLTSGLVDDSLKGYYRDQLRTQYSEILKLTPRRTDVRVSLGRLFLENNQLDEAKTLLEETIRIDPSDLEARFGMIEVLFLQRSYDEMYERIRQVVQEASLEEETAGEGVTNFVRLGRWWLSAGVELEKKEEGVPPGVSRQEGQEGMEGWWGG